MRSVANCTVSVLRGSETDDYGDTADTGNVVADRVPASILETVRRTTRRADDRAQTVLYFTGRVDPRVDVRQNDRLRDERTGAVYLVTSLSRVGNPVTVNDSRLDLERVSVGSVGTSDYNDTSTLGNSLPFTIGA